MAIKEYNNTAYPKGVEVTGTTDAAGAATIESDIDGIQTLMTRHVIDFSGHDADNVTVSVKARGSDAYKAYKTIALGTERTVVITDMRVAGVQLSIDGVGAQYSYTLFSDFG